MAKHRHTVLVVDDSAQSRLIVQAILRQAGYDVRLAESGARALEIYETERPAVCIIDLEMPEMSGFELLTRLRGKDATAELIVLTAHGSIERAVQAMRAGAVDFLTKPVDRTVLLTRIEKALAVDALVEENRRLRAEVTGPYQFSNVIGVSAAMRAVVDLAREAARSEVTVLITGESGTGKELLARAIHYASARRAGPFFAVNCAAIAENLVESELFGYERGAFTGADRRKEGLLEQAGRGTLMLDEIGDMPLPLQARLLRVIENREMLRVGATQPVPVDARIIAATNADLPALVAENRFRSDLYYRLAVFTIEIPPLRERPEDIPLLAERFLSEITHKTGKRIVGFAPDALDAICRAAWPGNVRELQNVIERAVILCRHETIETTELPKDLIPELAVPPSPPPAGREPASRAEEIERAAEEVEREALRQALAECKYNLSATARMLGIGRGALRYRLERLGVDPARKAVRSETH